jgi:DNA modification methylase
MAGADPDDVPEPPKKAVTKPGDLWILGEHRLLCGDATNVNDIDRLMIGGVADICITSPPYFNQRPEYSTWKSYDDYLKFISDIIKTMPMARNAVVGINIGSDEQAHRWMPADWWCALRDNGWKYQESFAWVKAAAVWSVPRSMHIENGHYYPAQRWEIILTVSRGKHPKFDISDRDRIRAFQDNVWQMPVVVGSAQKAIGHPAMFPVELPNRFVTAYSQIAAIVYEPFAGSGTTIIACEQLNRRCFAMEIDPIYCDVSVKRWETFTGKKAVLQK